MRNILEQYNKVKQASIKDVCQTINAPIKIQKSEFSTDGKFPIIDQSANLVAGYTNNKEAIISNGEYVIFGDHTRIIKFVDYPFAQGADGIKILKAKNNVLPKYLFYSLCNLDIPNKGYSRHWGLVSNLTINLPLVNVQEEIVEILDSFTNLIDALNEELSLRQKQFEYYREKLLKYKEEFVVDTLENIAPYSKKRISSEELNENNYVGVDNLLQNKEGKTNSKNVPISGNLTRYEKGDILIGNIRPYLKKIWYADNVGGASGDVLVFSIKEKELINSRYLYYILSSDEFFDFDNSTARGGSMPRGDKKVICKYLIWYPKDIEIQQSIVEKLDAFESLISSLKEEIALRQKQYEYYREKLLTFD